MTEHIPYGSRPPVARHAHGAHRAGAAGHGGYLVTYPEALERTLPDAPSIWPVAAWTVSLGLPGLMVAISGWWFGILGLLLVPAGLLLLGPGAVAARRRARKAAVAAPYWVTFAVAATGTGLLAVATLAVAVPSYLQVREAATVLALQENIVEDGQLAKATGLTAVQVDCRAAGRRDSTDHRPYSCVTTLNDGRTGFVNVRADSRGNWSLAPTP